MRFALSSFSRYFLTFRPFLVFPRSFLPSVFVRVDGCASPPPLAVRPFAFVWLCVCVCLREGNDQAEGEDEDRDGDGRDDGDANAEKDKDEPGNGAQGAPEDNTEHNRICPVFVEFRFISL